MYFLNVSEYPDTYIHTVLAQDLPSPENKPFLIIKCHNIKGMQHTSKKCQQFVKCKYNIDRG